MRTKRCGFTLIEMLVATVLASVLMAVVLTAIAGVALDRQALHSVKKSTAAGLADLVAWDIGGARTLARGPAEDAVLILIGNNGISPATRVPDGRLVRVTYRTAGASLWRQQEYLDDPVRPQRWQAQAAGDFRAIVLQPPPAETPARVADRVRIDVVTAAAAETRQVTR